MDKLTMMRVRKQPMIQCPLTKMALLRDAISNDEGDEKSTPYFVYQIDFDGEKTIKLCQKIFNHFEEHEQYLSEENKKFKNDVERYLPFFSKILSENNFSELFSKIIHFECDIPRQYPDTHLNIKDLVDEVYPIFPSIEPKEQKDLLLQTINNQQEYLHGKVYISNFRLRANSYIKDSDQLFQNLKSLQKRDLIEIENNYVRLTDEGLTYIQNDFKSMAGKNSTSTINIDGNKGPISIGDGNTSIQTQHTDNTTQLKGEKNAKEVIQLPKKYTKKIPDGNDLSPTKKWQIIGVCAAIVMGIIAISFSYFFGK